MFLFAPWWFYVTSATLFLVVDSQIVRETISDNAPADSTISESEDGVEFNPSIKASCVGGIINIRVDTPTSFTGIVHGKNYRNEPKCYTRGSGQLKTFLTLDLSSARSRQESLRNSPSIVGFFGSNSSSSSNNILRSSSSNNREDRSCGVVYDERRAEHRVAIAVRMHPSIELVQDKMYVISCGRSGFQNSRNSISIVQMSVAAPSNSLLKTSPSDRVVTAIAGQPYYLRAQVINHDPLFEIKMKRCFAFDNADSTAVQLVNEDGCVIDTLMSDFEYDQEEGRAQATIHSMFRMPLSNRTYFQCDVLICRKGNFACQTSTLCSTSNVAAVSRSNGESSLSPPSSSDVFDGPGEDSVTTSTSVFVALPNTEAAAAVLFSTSSYASDWLLWLCLAFGILFVLMLIVNIFLCSVMTCSCTRSEVIEREPSIYADDYSLYDSQYGGYSNQNNTLNRSAVMDMNVATVNHNDDPVLTKNDNANSSNERLTAAEDFHQNTAAMNHHTRLPVNRQDMSYDGYISDSDDDKFDGRDRSATTNTKLASGGRNNFGVGRY